MISMATKHRIPPHNIEAEESLLGAVFIDQESLLKVIDIVRPQDFYKDSHRIIYETMTELFERHEPIDLLTTGNRLEEKKKLKEIGGRTTLVELTNRVATAAHIKQYGLIISKKATLRRLLSTAGELVELAFNEEEEVDTIVDQAEQALFQVSSGANNDNFIPMRSVLSEAFERIDKLHQQRGQLRGLPTGFKGLDNLLGGLQNSDLIILAARPSVGKTSFSLDMVRNIAVKTKKPIGLFSLEMAKEQLVDRMICAQANVDL